tara:strand:- start:283 stop:468 length:186 start_codon:yes stop_codon:yes gene_type:complete
MLAESLASEFAPFRERAEYLRAHPTDVRDVLEAGADRARAVAQETLAEARSRMGLCWRSAL